MKTIFTLLSAIAFMGLAVPTTSMAAKKKTDTTTPDTTKTDDKKDDKKKKDTYPLYGEVVSITPALLTIKGGKDKPDRKFDITKDTKIHSGDKPASIKDVKMGAWVGGLVKKAEGGKGNDTLESLNLDVKQKGDKKDEKKDDTTTPPAKKKKTS
jgi:hypothetical protein